MSTCQNTVYYSILRGRILETFDFRYSSERNQTIVINGTVFDIAEGIQFAIVCQL